MAVSRIPTPWPSVFSVFRTLRQDGLDVITWQSFIDTHDNLQALYAQNGKKALGGSKLEDHFVWCLVERCRESIVFEEQVKELFVSFATRPATKQVGVEPDGIDDIVMGFEVRR